MKGSILQDVLRASQVMDAASDELSRAARARAYGCIDASPKPSDITLTAPPERLRDFGPYDVLQLDIPKARGRFIVVKIDHEGGTITIRRWSGR
jgi:hypothetical protein